MVILRGWSGSVVLDAVTRVRCRPSPETGSAGPSRISGLPAPVGVGLKLLPQVRCRAARPRPGHHLGAAGRHDRATEVSGAGPHVDDVIGRRDDAHVVFDHDDRVARIDQAVELEHEAVDIGRVQPGRRLVEDVERAPALPPLQFGRELDPLGLPAGEFGRRLAQAQVAETEIPQHGERPQHGGLSTRQSASLSATMIGCGRLGC